LALNINRTLKSSKSQIDSQPVPQCHNPMEEVLEEGVEIDREGTAEDRNRF